MERVIPANQEYAKMQEHDSGFNKQDTAMDADGKAGTLKRELNKAQMSMHVFYSLRTAKS